MALVSNIIGDCPACGRKDGYGNVSVTNNHLHRGCLSCRYWVSIPLPELNKKVLYLDQFFFSHAFRGENLKFVEAKEKISTLALDQLLKAPYSNFHEDESLLWTSEQRDPLMKFIKQTSGGHQFKSEYQVKEAQICRAFSNFLAKSSIELKIVLTDAVPKNLNTWDDFFWIDVGTFKTDPDKLRKVKDAAVNSLLDAFPQWASTPSTFQEDVAYELKCGGDVYINEYVEYVKNICDVNNVSAWLNSSVNSDSDDFTNTIIGIDNLKGKIYRYIEIDGMDDFFFVTDFLVDVLDMVDVLTFGARIRSKGCDNRYRPNGVMINGLATFRTQL